MTPKRRPGRPRKNADAGVNGPVVPPTADYRREMVDRQTEPASSPASSADRVVIPMKDGKIQWAEVRGDTGKLKDAIAAEPGAGERLGLVADMQELVAPVVTEEHAKALYAAVNDILQFTLARQTNFPRPEIARVIGYTQKEYEAMCPLTARVLNRYLPARLATYQDIMLLGVTLYEVHQRKWLQLREYIEGKVKVMADRAREETAEAVTQ